MRKARVVAGVIVEGHPAAPTEEQKEGGGSQRGNAGEWIPLELMLEEVRGTRPCGEPTASCTAQHCWTRRLRRNRVIVKEGCWHWAGPGKAQQPRSRLAPSLHHGPSPIPCVLPLPSSCVAQRLTRCAPLCVHVHVAVAVPGRHRGGRGPGGGGGQDCLRRSHGATLLAGSTKHPAARGCTQRVRGCWRCGRCNCCWGCDGVCIRLPFAIPGRRRPQGRGRGQEERSPKGLRGVPEWNLWLSAGTTSRRVVRAVRRTTGRRPSHGLVRRGPTAPACCRPRRRTSCGSWRCKACRCGGDVWAARGARWVVDGREDEECVLQRRSGMSVDSATHVRLTLPLPCLLFAQALGLTLGVFHVELKYTSRGARLVEVNCRMGGGPVRWVRVAGRGKASRT